MNKEYLCVLPPCAIIIADLVYCVYCIYSCIKGESLKMVAIAVSLIGLIGSVIALIIATVKDSSKVSSVKEDTVIINPNVETIKNDVVKVKDKVVEKLVPVMQSSEKTANSINKKVDELYDEMNYHKRLQQELSGNIKQKDYFVDGIEQLYLANGQLAGENKHLRAQLQIAQEQYDNLNSKLNELKTENSILKNKLKQRENQKSNNII